MDIIISHKTALEYWRLYGNMEINNAVRQRRKKLPASLPGSADIRNAMPSGLAFPVNLMINSQNAKRVSKIVKPRVYTGHVPDWSFVKIREGVSASAPPLCFFQMSAKLPIVLLIELGYELCGSYSLPAGNEYNNGSYASSRGFFNHPAFTGTKELKAYATRMKGADGYKKVSRALRYIIDGSASPMETILVMLLTLPHKLGGYGLPAPELNKRVDIGKAALQRPGGAYYKCDLFWPEANLAVEYDSNLYHTGKDRIAGDSKRRLDLTEIGVTVVTVTSGQVRNVIEFEKLAKLIAKKLGKQLRLENPKFAKARSELRELLL